MANFRVEYDNDTGPNDEGFFEYWLVTNDKLSFRVDSSQQDADWLAGVLNTQQPAAADEVAKHSTQDCYEHFLAYSGLEDSPWIKYAYFHGADVGLDRPSKPAPVAPAAATQNPKEK